MQVEDLKRWHWALIALVLGLVVSFAWSSVDWEQEYVLIGTRDFEEGLAVPYPKSGSLTNITVLPPVDGKHRVTAERARYQAAGETLLEPVVCIADIPYQAGRWRDANGEKHADVLAYLAKAKAQNPEVGYRYAWFRETWAIYLLWTGASVLLIGGVWPSLVSLMVGAGLGLKREKKDSDYDLSRFGGGADAKKPGAAQPTAADMDRLKQLEQELERKLAAQQMGVPMPDDAPAGDGNPAPLRKLDGGPQETAATDKPPEDHEYGGEFYPVDRGAKKKHD